MTTQKAIELLQTLRNICDAATGKMGEALDLAVTVMERSIIKADIESIMRAVTRETGVTEAEMCNKGRQREFSEARAIVTWLVRRYTPTTLTTIGKRLGRDHIVAIYYVNMVDSWLDEPRRNPRGARVTQKLINEIDNNEHQS